MCVRRQGSWGLSPHHKALWPTKGERTGRGVGWQLSISAGLVGVAGGATDECRLHFILFLFIFLVLLLSQFWVLSITNEIKK